MKYRIEAGCPDYLGARCYKDYINFAVAVKGDARCSLVLYHKGTAEIADEIDFSSDMVYGNVYAMAVYNLDINKYDYNYRINSIITVDPYAGMLSGTAVWGELRGDDVTSVVVKDDYNWEGDRPLCTPFEDSVIYRLHVRGFTRHSSSKVTGKGTYRGIIQKIPYLKELGITMIELMPAYEFVECEVAGSPINYWGYTGGNYFAPKASYAHSGSKGGQVDEFKDMVKQCHKNGIEVGMEFFFPSETNQSFILDCFRYWVRCFHIDSIHCNLGEDIKNIVKNDPLLGKTKLISNGWHADDNGGYWMRPPVYKNLGECHDGFMITARRFLKSDEGQVSDMTFRIRNNRSNIQVINYLADHNTLSVNDMVSYEWKHNEANGEGNRDGSDYNYSWNCGAEGYTRKKKVMELRRKQIRNAWMFLLLSQGTPMIYAGDEFLRTTQGNNNPYCQDNEISWVNWNLMKKNATNLELVKSLIQFRKTYRVLHMKDEMRIMDYRSIGLPDMSYHGSRAWFLDDNHLNRHFGIMYCGEYGKEDSAAEEAKKEENIYVAYNMYWENMAFGLPVAGRSKQWRLLYATDDNTETGKIITEKEVTVSPRSVAVFVSEDKPVTVKKKTRRVK